MELSLQPLAELLANIQADELQVSRKLAMPRERYVQDTTSSYVQSLTGLLASWEERIKFATTLLQEKLNTLPFNQKKSFRQELSALLRGENTTTESFQLWIYQEAYNYYQQRDQEQALAFFQLLVCLAPSIADYWIGLGCAQRQLGQEALFSFSLAVLLDPNNPIGRYQLALSYYLQKKWSDALLEIDALKGLIQTPSLEQEMQELENKILAKQRGGI